MILEWFSPGRVDGYPYDMSGPHYRVYVRDVATDTWAMLRFTCEWVDAGCPKFEMYMGRLERFLLEKLNGGRPQENCE